MANEEFDISEWNSKRALGELDEGLFAIDPALAHKIWEAICAQMEKIDKSSESDSSVNEYTDKFMDAFPTASGFANFLNKKIK